MLFVSILNILTFKRRMGATFRCPNCRKECRQSQIKRNNFVARLMGKLEVKCPNFEITPQRATYLKQEQEANQSVVNSRDNRRNLDVSRNDEKSDGSRSRSRSKSRSRERFVLIDCNCHSFVCTLPQYVI